MADPKGVCDKLCIIANPFKSSTQPILATNTSVHTGSDIPHKPNKARRKRHTFERKEIVVVAGQGRNYDLAHEKDAPEGAKEQSVRFSVDRINSKKNNERRDDHDAKFSDYISEVKKRIMRTMTRISGGGDHGPGRVTKRRDSFDDRVTNYIDQAKIKMIRNTTTKNAGDHHDKGFPSKSK